VEVALVQTIAYGIAVVGLIRSPGIGSTRKNKAGAVYKVVQACWKLGNAKAVGVVGECEIRR
jgi:hypothetical protein